MPTRKTCPRVSIWVRSDSSGFGGAFRGPSISAAKRAHEGHAHAVGLDRKVRPITLISRPAVRGRVADQRVGEGEGDTIHRARCRHAERHEADAAEVRHGVNRPARTTLSAALTISPVSTSRAARFDLRAIRS